jgi:cyanophycin synthetase
MNLFDFQKYKVLLDYGHNADSARAFAKLLPHFSLGRKIALCHGTGSRTNEQIIEYGAALASVYDFIVLTDFDPRDRLAGETTKLMQEGLIKGGFDIDNIEISCHSENAVDHIFTKAKDGDLIVIHPDSLEPTMTQILERYRKTVTLS